MGEWLDKQRAWQARSQLCSPGPELGPGADARPPAGTLGVGRRGSEWPFQGAGPSHVAKG